MSLDPKGLVDSKQVEAHFAFGKNWVSFVDTIDEQSIQKSEQGMLKLLARDELVGRSFLDIGCGSGLHALAAVRLGAGRIVATDIDPVSVQATQKLIRRQGLDRCVESRIVSVFELDPAIEGHYDIVYSWGVLHHTGDLIGAVHKAAAMTAPGGLLVFALYRRTSSLLDRFWIWEKRRYAHASEKAQRRTRLVYVGLLKLAFRVLRRDFDRHMRDYKERGADFWHDVHDWLGGHPYEVISPPEVEAMMRSLGFAEVRKFVQKPSVGIFGSGCDEYVYRRAR
jgi:2-polyprenyl-6-hydroxyphenyl methylase/3-demethylubiquinone-9 3-methyltransferase